MEHLKQSEVVSVTNPRLWFFAMDANGFLQAASSAEFKVFLREATGLTEVVDWAVIDLSATLLGVGRYVIPWTVPADADKGHYLVAVRWKIAAADEWTTHGYELCVADPGANRYRQQVATVQDVRNWGIAEADATDAEVGSKLQAATSLIYRATANIFDLRYIVARFDGNGMDRLPFRHPIDALEEVNYLDKDYDPVWDVDDEVMRVGNRHIRNRNTLEDDRADPHIAFYDPAYKFPEGRHNVEVKGVFGYTEVYEDEDNILVVNTPPQELRDAAVKIVWRMLPTFDDPDEMEDRREAHRVSSIKTKTQSVSFAPRAGAGQGSNVNSYPTGDPEIDDVIAQFHRPTEMGVV